MRLGVECYMKRRLILFALLSVAIAATGFAAAIDGAWTSQIKTKGKKGEKTTSLSFDLKSDGTALTGTVSGVRKKQGSTMVEGGKFENGAFSFKTVDKTRKGDVKFLWRGTVEGTELKGTRTREGAKRGMEFTAKRR